jgi:hypothetical protein
MRKALLFSIFVLCAGPAIAADNGKCDAVPFTLGKPAPPPTKAQKPQPATKPAPVTKTAEAKPKPAPKPRLYAPCDDSKAKKKSG